MTMDYVQEIKNIDNTEIFLPEESRVLDKTLKIREDIIDEILKEGIPTDSKTVRVVNEVLNAMDAQVLGKIDRRLKNNENKNNENMLELAKEIILNSKENVVENNDYRPEIEIELKDEEIVLEEDSLEYKELSYDDFKHLIDKE